MAHLLDIDHRSHPNRSVTTGPTGRVEAVATDVTDIDITALRKALAADVSGEVSTLR